MIEDEQIEHLLRVNRLAEAGEIVARCFAERPDDPEAHFYAARLACLRDDNASAAEHLAQTLARAPAHVPARTLRFHVLMDGQEYAEAEETILGLLREHPEEPEFLALYALLMLQTLHLDKAAALVKEALRLDPEAHDARLVHVLLSVIRGDKALAHSSLEELVADDPTALDVSYTVFQVLIAHKRHRDAFELGRELLRVDPTNQALVDALIELRAATHWLALPAYPLNRWGWVASGVLWFGAVVVMNLARRSHGSWAPALATFWFGYVVYSWVYGPLLKRWIRWRGF